MNNESKTLNHIRCWCCYLHGLRRRTQLEQGVEQTQKTSTYAGRSRGGEIPDVEPPSAEILDQLVPGSGISVPGLEQDLEAARPRSISRCRTPRRACFS